ncbi:hypothetical protein, partial [Brevibacterium sp.]|uniref:hypothetical protein n=1 Tax=Brevibacterium sp. TaxID=1701 RepID=UPI0026491651
MSDSPHNPTDGGAAEESNSRAAEDTDAAEAPLIPKKPGTSSSARHASDASPAVSGTADPDSTARFSPDWNQDSQQQ